jgi:site-specific recombinase XerD
MDITLISKFLGHSQISTTTIYTRVVIQDLKEMIDKLHPRNYFVFESDNT